jgi:hypothetical protein
LRQVEASVFASCGSPAKETAIFASILILISKKSKKIILYFFFVMYSPLLNSLSDLLVFDTSTALTTLQKGDSTLSIHVDARAEEEPVIWFMTAVSVICEQRIKKNLTFLWVLQSSASVVRSLEFAERKDLLSEKFRDTFVVPYILAVCCFLFLQVVYWFVKSEVMCPARDTFERLLHLGADCCLGMMFPASCSWFGSMLPAWHLPV